MRKKIMIVFLFFFLSLLGGCEYEYGMLGGADKTDLLTPGNPDFERIMNLFSGVWYSHYAGIGRLDGYRAGLVVSFDSAVPAAKQALFPDMVIPLQTCAGNAFTPGDYFVFYDDTVYGEGEDGTGGNGGWEEAGYSGWFRYCGVVRAINVFNGDFNRGAIIIEYFDGCAPTWDPDIKEGQRPFFGIYYRVLDNNTIQMANAVDLAAMYRGDKYYTEMPSLEQAVAYNSVENEAEFITWGVVIPQDREP